MSNLSNEIAALQPGEELVIRKRRTDSWSGSGSEGSSTGLALIFIMVLFGLDAVRSTVREAFPLLTNPLPAIAFGLIFFVANIYTNILLFQIYQLRVSGLAAKGA